MRTSLHVSILLLMLLVFSCYKEQEIPVVIDFSYTVSEGSYTVPVTVLITNTTTGADFYSWTFEGASPGISDKKQPGTIQYNEAGTYVVKLEAWNDYHSSSKEIVLQLDSAVSLDFQVDILVNDFAPATVQVKNRTRGASTYQWTFEDGTPGTSALIDPPNITFNTEGEHTITLKVTNGRESFSSSKTITLKPLLVPDFEIIPSFEDQDYEAPLIATLSNKSVSGLHYSWSSSGGVIQNASAENTEISFLTPGEYTVKLTADNDKEVKSIERTITVKPNTNLYSMADVKLGVSVAHTTIGAFYSGTLRTVLKAGEVTTENGSRIDLIFFGINSSFSYSRFLSPDSAAKFSFPAVPNATHTYFINTLSASGLSFSVTDFDNMTNDALIAGLSIKEHDTGIAYFTNSEAPYIVLFETQDGRKGAIKVKSFVSAGTQSYILADIKVQKLKP